MQKQLKTRQQIAAEYGVDRKTLYRWLKAHNIKLRGKYLVSPAEQEVIYRALDLPKESHSGTQSEQEKG